MERGQILNVDTTKSDIQNPLVKLRQGDGNYQSLLVTVRNSGEPINLTGWTITFMGTTHGEHKIIDSDVTIEDVVSGIFRYTPTKAWGQDIGEFKKAYFKLTKDDESASSANFRVNVLEAVDLTNDEASDYISVVDRLIDDVKTNLNTKLDETKSEIESAQQQATVTSEAVKEYTEKADKAVADVNNTASSAISEVNSTANNAIESINNQLDGIKAGDNVFTGSNEFTQPIKGDLSGNADTATSANDPNAVHKTDNTNFKQWSANTSYKLNDIVLVKTLGTATSGQINNGVMICMTAHTSGTSFPSSSDGYWKLSNIEAYTIEQSLTIGSAIGFKFVRQGQSVQGYPTTGTTSSIPANVSSWATLSGNLDETILPIVNTDILSVLTSTQHIFIWRFGSDGTIQFRQTWGSNGTIGSNVYFSLNAIWNTKNQPKWSSGNVS